MKVDWNSILPSFGISEFLNSNEMKLILYNTIQCNAWQIKKQKKEGWLNSNLYSSLKSSLFISKLRIKLQFDERIQAEKK